MAVASSHFGVGIGPVRTIDSWAPDHRLAETSDDQCMATICS